MKTNIIFKSVAIAATLLSSSALSDASAQLTYSSGYIYIGNAPRHDKLDCSIRMKGLYWTSADNKFFQLDVTPTSPRLAGSNDKVVFYNTLKNTFNAIEVAEVLTLSDERAKTNIKTLNSGLDAVLSLRPVSYNWKDAASAPMKASSANGAAAADSVTVAFGPESSTTQFGFIAQEVEQVVPSVVRTDETGNKMMNYIALIPMLVQSIQELHAVVEQQNAVIENLSAASRFNASDNATVSDCIVSCTPNPTRGDITFTYSLGNAATSARIIITNLSGLQKQSVACNPTDSSVTTNLSALQPGVYIATLVVDGSVKDSKQIVVAD